MSGRPKPKLVADFPPQRLSHDKLLLRIFFGWSHAGLWLWHGFAKPFGIKWSTTNRFFVYVGPCVQSRLLYILPCIAHCCSRLPCCTKPSPTTPLLSAIPQVRRYGITSSSVFRCSVMSSEDELHGQNIQMTQMT